MRKDIEGRLGSTSYARLEAVRLPHAKRAKALRALSDAQLSVDAFSWLTKKVEQLIGRLFLKPAL